jgi:hypothetical protein
VEAVWRHWTQGGRSKKRTWKRKEVKWKLFPWVANTCPFDSLFLWIWTLRSSLPLFPRSSPKTLTCYQKIFVGVTVLSCELHLGWEEERAMF